MMEKVGWVWGPEKFTHGVLRFVFPGAKLVNHLIFEELKLYHFGEL
jgi:hypothetical protein